jgi:glycosyltransferase involved in cell wall biosynthesis
MAAPAVNGAHVRRFHAPRTPDPAFLRQVAWEIGERRAGEAWRPKQNHVGLAMVSPAEGFGHWRLGEEWVAETARRKGDAWRDCRLVLRLYDVSYIHFNGLNAHRIHDVPLSCLAGHCFFKLPRPGTWQLGEAGFLLLNGEFVPGARSHVTAFAPITGSAKGGHAALLVTPGGAVEEVGNIWDQERILRERCRPSLRKPLRIAALAFGSAATGQDGSSARFVTELAAGQAVRGHEVHVFVPTCDAFGASRQQDGVHYHPLDVSFHGTPLEIAETFGRTAAERLETLRSFDLVHMHEWMAGLGSAPVDIPKVLSLSSVEAIRRNGSPVADLSRAIEEAECTVARAASCVLTPAWLRQRAAKELDLEGSRVVEFPLEGRLPNEWETPLDPGQVKMGFGVGPLDRLFLFIGPLEYAAGVDLLVDALPVILQRAGSVCLAFVGAGAMHGHLGDRARHLGVGHAVHLLGHIEGPRLTRLLRSAEALVLPSRYRVPFDDAVVDLARRAGRAVITTHGGPAHLVRHEENGLVTYDNPGSMVWAFDRLLGDPGHADRLGNNGRRVEDRGVMWSEVAGCYLELCAARFPQLTELRW